MKKLLYYSDWVITPALALYFTYLHFTGLDWSFLYVAMGFFCWTLLEYLIHAYVHDSRDKGHIVHHARPLTENGPSLVTRTTFLSVLWILLFGIYGFAMATGIYAGFLIGYSSYLALHEICHRTAWFRDAALIKHHLNHHKGKKHTLGVTTRFWDFLAKTIQGKR